MSGYSFIIEIKFNSDSYMDNMENVTKPVECDDSYVND